MGSGKATDGKAVNGKAASGKRDGGKRQGDDDDHSNEQSQDHRATHSLQFFSALHNSRADTPGPPPAARSTRNEADQQGVSATSWPDTAAAVNSESEGGVC